MDQATSARIMVIGSDSHFSYLMRRYVRTSSHQIILVSLCEDALVLAQREKPAAIVLEADLPDNRGWHTLRALKADQTTGKIPVILCSWLDEKERGLKREPMSTCGCRFCTRILGLRYRISAFTLVHDLARTQHNITGAQPG